MFEHCAARGKRTVHTKASMEPCDEIAMANEVNMDQVIAISLSAPDPRADEEKPQGATTQQRRVVRCGRNNLSEGDQKVHSVLLASGLDIDINIEAMSEIPTRHTGGTKASLAWFGKLCIAGIGMFVEAYIIITTGQIKSVWHDQYPECWTQNLPANCPGKIECTGLYPNTPEDLTPDPSFCNADGSYPANVLCREGVPKSISYSEFAGILVGMLAFGYIADLMGRKKAGVVTSLFMLTGITVMTFLSHEKVNTLFIVWSAFFGVFGLGVGGEYPLTASGAAEHHAESVDMAKLDDEARRRERMRQSMAKAARRGETISIVFAMQGVGAVFGSLVLLCLIYFAQQGRLDCEDSSTNTSGSDPHALNAVWRSFYFFGLLMIMFMLAYRFFVVEESDSFSRVQARKQKREEKLGKHSTARIIGFYWPRLIGTAGCWFLWDIGFYGLKLFSGPIFKSFNPSGDLMTNNLFIFINNAIALGGYYSAAAVIDRKKVGRVRLQIVSTVVTALLLYLTAATFNFASTGVKLFLFYASSFFGQFGANTTTYVMAAETYPTELRATCHGISSFAGKLGALVATISFGYMNTVGIFYTTATTCLFASIFTALFACDLTHVSLAEHDAQLELFLEGRPTKYEGVLNKKEHLSTFERWTGRHGSYDRNWAKTLVKQEMENAPIAVAEVAATSSAMEFVE